MTSVGDEPYWYQRDWNPDALYAFVSASIIALVFALIPFFGDVAPFSWFIGAGIAGALYWFVAKRQRMIVMPGSSDNETQESREG